LKPFFSTTLPRWSFSPGRPSPPLLDHFPIHPKTRTSRGGVRPRMVRLRPLTFSFRPASRMEAFLLLPRPTLFDLPPLSPAWPAGRWQGKETNYIVERGFSTGPHALAAFPLRLQKFPPSFRPLTCFSMLLLRLIGPRNSGIPRVSVRSVFHRHLVVI